MLLEQMAVRELLEGLTIQAGCAYLSIASRRQIFEELAPLEGRSYDGTQNLVS